MGHVRVQLQLCQRPCFLIIFLPLSLCAQKYLYEIHVCGKRFAHTCKGLALTGCFRGFFYNSILLLQPKLTQPESLINTKWSWICNNWFSLLSSLRVSWLLPVGLIIGEVIVVYEPVSDSILHADLWQDTFRREAGKQRGWFLEERETQLQSSPSPELHSCFIQAGNTEIKGALHG